MNFRKINDYVSYFNNNLTKQSLQNMVSICRRNEWISYAVQASIKSFVSRLIQMACNFGTFEGIHKDICETLSYDCISLIVDNYKIETDFLMGICLVLAIRIRDGQANAAQVLKKILNSGNLSLQRSDFQNDSSKYYSYVYFIYQQFKGINEMDTDFSNFQLDIDKAVDPNQNSTRALITKIFWLEGVFYELKNFAIKSCEINQDILDVIQMTRPYFTEEFSKIFADSLFQEIQTIKIRQSNAIYITFPFFRLLKLLDNSNKIIDSYFEAIINSLISDNFNKGIDEITYIINHQSISDYELQSISSLYDFLLANDCKISCSAIIEPLTSFLFEKKILNSQSLFDKLNFNTHFYMKLFQFIEPALKPTIIDDTYRECKFSPDTARFIFTLLKTGRYQSTQLDSIFYDTLKLDGIEHLKRINEFSNQEQFKDTILKAVRKYVAENELDSRIFEICAIINNCDLSDQINQPMIEKISDDIPYLVDSIEILTLFYNFKFLVINDLPCFVDLSPHNSLFYQILIEKNLPTDNELVEELINFNDEDENPNYCSAFHEFLAKAYNDTKEKKFMFKLLEITDFNNNDDNDEYSNDETVQSLALFHQYLQDTENKDIVTSIIQILQENKPGSNQNLNLKNFLISVSDLKDILHFSSADEINSLVSSMTLNDDSLAFIASIGGSISEDQLDSLFNSSDNFYPKYVVASLFPSSLEKFTEEQKMDCYTFGCIIQHYRLCLSIISSVSPLLKQESYIFDDFIYTTSSKIAALTLSHLEDSESGIFNDPEQVKTFITTLYESKTQDNFDLVFSTYLNRLKKNDKEMCIAVWSIYFDKQFPPYYRNDKNNYELFKFVSTSTSTFTELMKKVTIMPFSIYRPSIPLNYLQMFSNVPSVYLTVEHKSYSLHFFKLLFGTQDQLNGAFQDKTILDFVKTLKINEKFFETVTFNFSENQLESDTLDPVHPIIPKGSVSQSLFGERKMFTIVESPKVLLIRIEGKVEPDFVIDEKLDLSRYSLNTTYYELRSVGCEDNIAYLKQKGTSKYLKCTKRVVTSVDKIDSTNINVIIYEKVKNFNESSEIKNLTQFWHEKEDNIKQILDSNQAILRCLQSDSIDWTLFEQTDDFFNTAIKLIKLGVKKVFTALSKSSKFASMFFDQYYSLFEDDAFIQKYKDEILNLAQSYDSNSAILSLNLGECLNAKNIEIYFELIDKFEIIKNLVDNRIGIIEIIPDNLINNPHFEKFFIDTINMPECIDELINYLIIERKNLIPLMLKSSRQKYFHLFSSLIDKDQFASIVKEFEPEFVVYALEHCPGKRSEFLPIALKEIRGSPELDEYLNRTKDDFTINDIRSIYEAGEIEFATSILESKYPSQTTTKQDEIKEMFIQIFKKSKSPKLYISLYKVIYDYHSIFTRDPEITELVASFVFTLRGKQIQDNIDDFSNLIDVLPPLSWNKVIGIFTKSYPLKNNESKRNFSQLNASKMSLFMLKLASNSIQSYEGYVYERILTDDLISPITLATGPLIINKKEFVDLILSTFKKFLPNDKVYCRYVTDMKAFPYILLKMIELTVDQPCWRTEYAFLYSHLILETISNIYNKDMPNDVYFYLDEDNDNDNNQFLSASDKCTIALLRLSTTNLEKNFLNPNVTDIKFQNDILVIQFLKHLDTINIEKLSDNVKQEFFKFLKTISYIYPLFLEEVVDYIIVKKSKVNMYQRIRNEETTKVYTDLVCNLFREMIGDRQYIQSANDYRFKKAVVLLKSQLMCLLLTKNFTYQQFEPYYLIFTAFFKSKDPQIISAFSNCLKKYPFVLYLLYTRDIKVGNVDNSIKINLFLTNFFSKVGPMEDPYPQIIIEFIKSVKLNDPQLKEKINILLFLFKSKFLEKIKTTIVQYCFNELEQIALQRTDIPKAKELFDIVIILLGL